MRLTVEQCLDAIGRHTRGLAEAAAGHLDQRVEHCPDWSAADLVWHVAGVHRLWEFVAREQPASQPSLPELQRPPDDEVVPALLTGLDVLLETLRAADPAAPCWTWGLEENVGFIIRHQVQEAAVHHWDAVNATAAGSWQMRPLDAIDAVEEFLTHSVGNRRWPAEGAEPLGGEIWFCPCVADTQVCPTWFITDGETPGTLTLTVEDGGVDLPEHSLALGHHVAPEDVLLWLYRRLPDDDPRVFDRADLDPGCRALLARFRALTYTD
jgi:mycothiol maleylpyruvate isomerase-like protein